MTTIYHALGLHLHQPPGNMLDVIRAAEHEAIGIVHAYDRIVRYAHRYKDTARLHVGMSGILLDQLTDQAVADAYRPYLDIQGMLRGYREADNIELLGMGHFHPIFPLIPKEDWPEQLVYGRQRIAEVFGREPKGFWPPEMAFCMEMIPAIVEAGYEYIVVDSFHIRPLDVGTNQRPDLFRAYLAEFDGAGIAVVPRNRDVSNAQESGMDAGWFSNEVLHKVAESPAPQEPRLVCTWSDGENGGWFRNMSENANFWGYFFSPFMDQVRSGGPIQPIRISEYLAKHPPRQKANVQTGAWNVASTSGVDFSQWNGTTAQKRAVDEVIDVSRSYWELKDKISGREVTEKLNRARKLILEAETSCFLFWGDSWVPKVYERTKPAREALEGVKRAIGWRRR
ncbi:MAG: glycoside hydrolase family 57 [Deltaproteobacteria bacterium]|nr:glycoside hydrolase family 57 [Deltaproteobacteria bacterium]